MEAPPLETSPLLLLESFGHHAILRHQHVAGAEHLIIDHKKHNTSRSRLGQRCDVIPSIAARTKNHPWLSCWQSLGRPNIRSKLWTHPSFPINLLRPLETLCRSQASSQSRARSGPWVPLLVWLRRASVADRPAAGSLLKKRWFSLLSLSHLSMIVASYRASPSCRCREQAWRLTWDSAQAKGPEDGIYGSFPWSW